MLRCGAAQVQVLARGAREQFVGLQRGDRVHFAGQRTAHRFPDQRSSYALDGTSVRWHLAAVLTLDGQVARAP